MMNIHGSTIVKDKDDNVGHVPVFNHRDGSRSDVEIEPLLRVAETYKFFIHFVVLLFTSRSTDSMTCGGSLGKFPPSRSYGLFFVGRKHFLCTGEESPLLFFPPVSSPVSTLSLCVHVENMCTPPSLFCRSPVNTVTVWMWRTSVLLPYPSSF